MKQTAVDWLFTQLWDRPKDKMVWYYIFEKSKQMEKEQIKEAHLNGQSEWDIKALEDINKKLSEEYYKETYEEDGKIYKRISDMPEFMNPIGTDTLNE